MVAMMVMMMLMVMVVMLRAPLLPQPLTPALSWDLWDVRAPGVYRSIQSILEYTEYTGVYRECREVNLKKGLPHKPLICHSTPCSQTRDCVSIWSRGMFVRIRFPQLGYIFSNYSQLGHQAQIVGRLLPSCLLLQPAAGVWSLCTLHSFHYAQCTLKYAHVSTKSRCWITTHTHFEKCRRAKEFTIWNMIWADAGLLYTLCTMVLF